MTRLRTVFLVIQLVCIAAGLEVCCILGGAIGWERYLRTGWMSYLIGTVIYWALGLVWAGVVIWAFASGEVLKRNAD